MVRKEERLVAPQPLGSRGSARLDGLSLRGPSNRERGQEPQQIHARRPPPIEYGLDNVWRQQGQAQQAAQVASLETFGGRHLGD